MQKRVGCRLQNLKKKEKGLGGRGISTDRIIDKLQNYCGINNLGINNLPYLHGPTRPDTWCKYNKDIADGTSTIN